MVQSLTKQGGRKYRQFGSSLALAVSVSVSGTTSVGPVTVSKRIYPSYRRLPLRVETRNVYGTVSSGGSGGFSRGQVVNNPVAELFKQSTARNKVFLLVLSSDHVTGATGAGGTLAVKISKNGAAFATVTPTVTELESGWYSMALTTSHTDTLGDLAFHLSATNCDPCDFVVTVEVDRPGATVSSVTGNVAGNVGGSVGSINGITFPANFSLLSIDASGRIKVQSGIQKNTALTGFMLLMTDSTTHAPKTSAAVTGTVSLNGGAFATLTNAVSEVSGGWYKVDLAAADVNADVVAFRFVASGADDSDISFKTSA